jgi:hypothetical protein
MPGPSPSTDWWAQRAPSASAAVLTTGTLSVGLDLAGYGVLSRIALGLACAAWLMLAVDFTLRLLLAGTKLRSYAGVPGLVDTVATAALTTVAATAVLGTGFSAVGSQALAAALLVLALLIWPVALARPAEDGERRRRPGTVFARCMATQGLAVLGATLAATESAAWLAHAALVLFWLGLVLYILALARFDVRQVAEGRGDHWFVAGALALSALAGARLISSDSAHLYLWNVDDRGTLRHVTVALLVLTPGPRRRRRHWPSPPPSTSPGSTAWGKYCCGSRWPRGSESPPGRSPRPGPTSCPAGSGPEHGDEDVRRGQRPDQAEQTLVHLLVVPFHVDEAEDHDQQGQFDADLDVVHGLVVGLVEADQDHTGDQHRQRAVQHRGGVAGGALAHRLHLGEETAQEGCDADDVEADEQVDEYVHEAGA